MKKHTFFSVVLSSLALGGLALADAPHAHTGLSEATPYLHQLAQASADALIEAGHDGDAGATLEYLDDAERSIDEARRRILAGRRRGP